MPATPDALALLVTPSTPSATALSPLFIPAIAPAGAAVEPMIAIPAGLEAVRVTDVMLPAANEPVPSRFTMALAVSLVSGGTFHANPKVPALVTGEPLTVKSELGALRPTLVTVPVPGKVWPVAKVIFPLLAMLSPVSVMGFEPAPKSRFSDPLGLALSLPTGSACQRKFWGTAVPALLL
jgi:hypothetical protein